jgi:hypothetical protein
MKAGKYWIGDLCYVMESDWREVCQKTSSSSATDVSEGEFELDDGTKFAMLNTAYGDGIYYDQNGRGYSVDSGTIGCILVDDIKGFETAEVNHTLGNIIDFPNGLKVENNEGILTFDGGIESTIHIDTVGAEDDDDDDYDSYCFEDDVDIEDEDQS